LATFSGHITSAVGVHFLLQHRLSTHSCFRRKRRAAHCSSCPLCGEKDGDGGCCSSALMSASFNLSVAYILSVFLLKAYLSVFLLKAYSLFQTQCKYTTWTYEYKTFPWLFQNFWYYIFFKDFSRPGNNHFKITWLSSTFTSVQSLLEFYNCICLNSAKSLGIGHAGVVMLISALGKIPFGVQTLEVVKIK